MRQERAAPNEAELCEPTRSPYCVLAFEAVAKLRECGFTARRLDGGYPEWKAAGLRVETLQDEAGKRLTARKTRD